MAIIYFDQMVWINLLRCYRGKSPEYPKYKEICQKVIETSDSKKHKYILSVCHLIETQKRMNLDSRKDLFKFIFSNSKFNTIIPYTMMLDLEIRNAILLSLNKKSIDLSKTVFGEGMGHCFGKGGEPTFKFKDGRGMVPNELKKNILSKLKDPQIMAEILSKKYGSNYIKKTLDRDEKLVEKLEEVRKKEYSHPNKDIRKNMANAIFLHHIIRDKLITEIINLNVENKEKYVKNTFSGKENIMNFLKTIPTAYTFHILNHARLSNKSRKIRANDLYDLGALSIAIPYCDVVVTEREWARILNEKGIGKLYSTKILYKMGDLKKIL